MEEECYRAVREIMRIAKELNENPLSPSKEGRFYRPVRAIHLSDESDLYVRFLANGSPIYLLRHGEEYTRLGRVKEVIERYPSIEKMKCTNKEKLKRLDLLPITCEEALEKALKLESDRAEKSRKAAA